MCYFLGPPTRLASNVLVPMGQVLKDEFGENGQEHGGIKVFKPSDLQVKRETWSKHGRTALRTNGTRVLSRAKSKNVYNSFMDFQASRMLTRQAWKIIRHPKMHTLFKNLVPRMFIKRLSEKFIAGNPWLRLALAQLLFSAHTIRCYNGRTKQHQKRC